MGNLFMRNKMAEKAIPLFKKTLKLKPDFIEAYISLGNAFKYLKKFKEAIYNFRKIVELKPNFPGGHINLGAALQDNGQFKEAIPYLKRFGVASKARALECLYHIKNFTEYNKYLSELSKTNPVNIRAATIAAYVSHQLDIKNIYLGTYGAKERLYKELKQSPIGEKAKFRSYDWTVAKTRPCYYEPIKLPKDKIILLEEQRSAHEN